MDPLFELAGALLQDFDDEWTPKPSVPRAGERTTDEDEASPELRPDEARETAATLCRERIAIVKRAEQQHRPMRDVWRRQENEHGEDSERSRRGGPDSLRTRRVLLTRELYLDARFALSAVRAVNRYPLYIGDIAGEVEAPEPESREHLTRAVAASDERLGEIVALFAPDRSLRDRLLVDRDFALEVTDRLALPQPFAFILQREVTEVRKSRVLRERGRAGTEESVPIRSSPYESASAMQFLGVCLSGGGVRSATFGLGVLQALADLNLLTRVDYFSTVSGGGYIGSWVMAWIKRLRGGVREAQQRLCPSRGPHPNSTEARPVRMLREYSNYLTPQAGLFSPDTWTMAVVWVRNTFLNLLVILLLLTAVLLVPRWFVPFTYGLSEGDLLRLFVLATLTAVVFVTRNLNSFESVADDAHSYMAPRPRGHGSAGIVAGVLAPVLVAGVTGAAWMWRLLNREPPPAGRVPLVLDFARDVLSLGWIPGLQSSSDAVVRWMSTLAPQQAAGLGIDSWLAEAEWRVFSVAVTCILTGLVTIQVGGNYARCMLATRGREPNAWRVTGAHLWIAAAGAVSAGVGGVAAAMLLRIIERMPGDRSYWYAIAFIPPLLTSVLALVVVLHMGLLGRDFPDERREWWSRLGALHFRLATIWLIAFAVSVFAPGILGWTHRLWAGSQSQIALVAAWLATTWGGVLAGKAAETRGVPAGGWRVNWREYLARIAPFVFILGLLIATSVLAHRLILEIDCPTAGTLRVCDEPWRSAGWLDWRSLDVRAAYTPWTLFLVAAALCALLSWRIDINEFSMHHFYKNRLVRCYLGASIDAVRRRPNEFTGLDPHDDVKLRDLVVDPPRRANQPQDPFEGPYLVVNAALNLTKGRELAWQERKAESFVFTPLFTGYEVEEYRPVGGPNLRRAGYRPTREFAYPDGPGLGTVAAISGAAANPNMGHHSSPATAFLMTVFNARLGWWMGNPRYDAWIKRSRAQLSPWRQPSPRLGLIYLLNELLGRADNRTRYINISDGGHFENLGLYELVRRRCRFVVVVDAEQDAAMAFEGLANAIRKCRTDFDVSIEIDVADIRRKGLYSRAHCASGRIFYPEPGAAPGHLLYIKSSLTGDEPSDILEYAMRHEEFPHQSTGDQWFDESQFESYRVLGYHATQDALGLAVRSTLGPGANPPLQPLFDYLRELWTPVIAAAPEDIARHAELYSDLYKRIHAAVTSGKLDQMVFDVPPAIGDRDELYLSHALIELMHRVFVDLKLDTFSERPHNAGWMKIFQHWYTRQAVRNTWTRVSSTYSQRFRSFVENLPHWKGN